MQTKLLEKDTPFGKLEIYDVNCERWMLINGACQGRMNLHTGEPASAYQKEIIRRMEGRLHERILCLGGGPYLLPSYLAARHKYVDIVEQNDYCFKAAIQFFRFNTWNPNTWNHTKDAKDFVVDILYRAYDAIVLDLYNGYDGGDFYTPEYLTFLKMKCKYLYVNRITDGKNVVEDYECN